MFFFFLNKNKNEKLLKWVISHSKSGILKTVVCFNPPFIFYLFLLQEIIEDASDEDVNDLSQKVATL